MESLLAHVLLSLSLFTHRINPSDIESHFNEDLECDMSKTSLNRYWTNNNLLRPNGCINRTNISLIYMDGGSIANQFYNAMRDGPRRVCIDYGISCAEPVHGDVATASVIPQIATDIAGTTRHGFSDIVGISLPAKRYTGLSDVHNQGIITSTVLGEMYSSSYNPYGTSLHVTQDDYLSGYDSCHKMIRDFGVTNILVIVPKDAGSHNTRRLACLDAMIDNGFSNASYAWMAVQRLDVEYDISLVAQALLNNTNVNGIFATAIKPHDPAYYLLNRALNGNGSEALYNFTKEQATSIKCLSQIDFSPVTIDGFYSNITKFASSQQPFVMTSISMLYLAIYASTKNEILFNHTLLSGPHFIESYEEAVLLKCTESTVRYCHDRDPINPFNNCSCINTQTANKTMYLFHYGRHTRSEYHTYFQILENGAKTAANDHNISLNIIASDNITTFDTTVQSTVVNDMSNDRHNGIISPIPNVETQNVFANYVRNSKQNVLIGVANGYEYYKALDIEQGNFFGSDDILSGYEMSRLLHKNYSIKYAGNELKSVVCIDDSNGMYASINDRCLGVQNYCAVHSLTYQIIANANSIVSTYSGLESPIGIVSPGYSTCEETQTFVQNEREINSTNQYIVGCFDSSSKHALNGLINEDIQIIIDNQPWLIGYLSVVSLVHKLFLARNLASQLIETGPKVITALDNDDIQLKVCENVNYGFDFCPAQPEPGSEKEINYPTLDNFSGLFLLLLFLCTAILVIFICVALYKYRKKAAIRTSQPLLLLFTIMGGILMMCAGLLFFNATDYSHNLLNNYVCNAPLSVWCVGFTLFFISYTLRVWKYVKAIEAGLNLSQKAIITTKGVLLRLFVFVCVDVLLVILASNVTPIQATIRYQLSNTNGRLTDILTSECVMDSDSYLWYIVLIYKLILIIWVLMVAFRGQASNEKIKKLKFLKLTEGPNVTMGVYIVIISFLLYTIIAISSANNDNIFAESTKWVLISSLSFICLVTTLSCIVINKFILIWRQTRLEKTTLQLAHSTSVESSNTGNTVEMSSMSSDEDYSIDQYLHRFEYLIDEAMELLQSSSFSSKAAKSVLPKVMNIQIKARQKSLQSGTVSNSSTAKVATKELRKDIELTTTNVSNECKNENTVTIVFSDT